MTATRLRLPIDVRSACVAALLSAMLANAAATSARAQDDDPGPDLQGILPEYIPDGLSEADFNELDGNWAEWAAETGRLVGDFYISDNDEVRGRRTTLERLRIKLDTMQKSLNDPQYLSIHGPLADLYGRLSRRVDVAEALLVTIEHDASTAAADRFRAGLAELAGTTRALRSHMESITAGDKWIAYLRLNEIGSAAEAGDTSAATRELLVSVQNKLDARTRYEEDQRSFLSRDQVLDFEDSLDLVLTALQVPDPDALRARLRELAGQLMEAVEEYENEPTAEHMEAVRNTYDDIRRLAPDGGARLTEAMRLHHLNYNLRVVVDETLLQDILRDSRRESGYINEMVSGARVTGCQWTSATVNMDLKPSDTGVQFDLILNGTVRSSVQGETHVATVYTSGRHCFAGRKAVHFDGDHFQHWRATIGVGGTNCLYAAETCMSWAPLLGGLSEDVVLKVANAKAPEANDYARDKIAKESRTQFDRETGNMLRDTESSLEEKVYGPLREGGYYPDYKELHSTETDMHIRTRLMESGELGGDDLLVLPIYPTHGALVQVHESLLNQIGDRLELDGKRFTPEALEEYLESEIKSITGQEADLSSLTGESADPNSPKVEEIIFHDSDAARFQVRDGEVVLVLSLGLKLENREEIPPQRISVPLNFSLAGDKIAMQRGTVGVSPIGPVAPGERGQQITRAGVMRTKIQEAFEPQEFDATFTFTVGEKKVTLRITDLRARGGWLSVIATDGIQEHAEEQVEPSGDGVTSTRQLQYVRAPQTSIHR